MRVRRFCPDHVFVDIGSMLDAQLSHALEEGALTDVSGFPVWVTHRVETAAHNDTASVRFDLVSLTTSRPD